jgi:hypothetical protein
MFLYDKKQRLCREEIISEMRLKEELKKVTRNGEQLLFL